ncbi:hypothetical protein ACFQOZ_15600 [Comamonas endophytica]
MNAAGPGPQPGEDLHEVPGSLCLNRKDHDMPQQANQPGTSQVPGQQEGKMGQWSPAEGDPNLQKKQPQNPGNDSDQLGETRAN